MVNKNGLTFLQEKFKNNILEGMDAKNAYIKAGYKARGNTAEVNASRLLRHAKVQDAIRKFQEKCQYNAEVTAERILTEEKCLAYSNATKVFEEKNGTLVRPDELPEETQRAISGLEITETEVNGVKTTKYKYKFWDKGRSLERMGKYLGMFEKDNAQKAANIESCVVKFISADGKEITRDNKK